MPLLDQGLQAVVRLTDTDPHRLGEVSLADIRLFREDTHQLQALLFADQGGWGWLCVHGMNYGSSWGGREVISRGADHTCGWMVVKLSHHHCLITSDVERPRFVLTTTVRGSIEMDPRLREDDGEPT